MDADFVAQLKASETAVPSGERRVALALHGMAAADREWMLQQLGADRRKVIERLLTELRELGVTAPAQSLAAELDMHSRASAAVEKPAREALRQLPAEVLHQLLRHEPDRLIEDMLRLGPFEEQAELTRLLRGSGRRIEPPMTGTTDAPPRRTELLVDTVLRRARECTPAKPVTPPAAAAPAAPSWLQRLLQRRSRS
jgi:hypothetical protein